MKACMPTRFLHRESALSETSSELLLPSIKLLINVPSCCVLSAGTDPLLLDW